MDISTAFESTDIQLCFIYIQIKDIMMSSLIKKEKKIKAVNKPAMYKK